MAPPNPYKSSAGMSIPITGRESDLSGSWCQASGGAWAFLRERAAFWGQHLCSPGVGGGVRYLNFLNLRLLIYQKRTIQLVSEDD